MARVHPFVALLWVGGLAVQPLAADTAEGFVQGADQNRIHYLQAGPTDARHTLLLIPGWRVSSRIWSKQLSYFSAHQYHIVAIDSRSQGGSAVAQLGNAPENRARDIQQVIAQLHLTHLILVGWSQGVQDVAAYVEQFGTGALEGLVLIDSAVSAGPGSVEESPAFVKAILQGIAVYALDPRAYSNGMMHAIISTPTPLETFEDLVEESMKTPPDIGISMLIQDLFTTDRSPVLSKFDKPTLVIASGQNRTLEGVRRMAAALPRAQLAVMAEAAHAVFFDQPDDFNQRLDDFVAHIDAGVGEAAH